MLTIVIQAGGESRRMGQDKALAPFLGEPMVSHVLERVRKLADEVLVTTNTPGGYQFLDVPLVPDLIPGRGPLGGLYTALSAAHHPLVGVVACDMPFVNPALLASERDMLENYQYDAVIPWPEKGSEPFHSVYRRAVCLPYIEVALREDHWRVDAWFSKANIYFLKPEEIFHYDPEGLAFWNVNTPEEFQQAEAIARATLSE